MKFYLLVILEPALASANDAGLRVVVQERLAPFGQSYCEAQGRSHLWDYCWCCDKQWLQEEGVSIDLYPQASGGHELLVFPAHTLTEEGVPAALLTPDGSWHESTANLRQTDPHWPARALQLANRYVGYPSLLVYAHR